jgi:hypothetical protein
VVGGAEDGEHPVPGVLNDDSALCLNRAVAWLIGTKCAVLLTVPARSPFTGSRGNPPVSR